MLRTLSWVAVGALFAAGLARAEDASYTIKPAQSPVPKELAPAVGNDLSDQAVQLLDGKNGVLAEVWFRKALPVTATAEQFKNGLTYQEVPQTTVVGAVRVVQAMTDYRKQMLKPGVYTLRFAIQPMDGDHMGTAPFAEFCVLSPAADDKKLDPMAPKELQEMSTKVTGTTHPAVLVLFPYKNPAGAAKLIKEMGGHWILDIPVEAIDGKVKGTIGIGLTLVGTSSAA